MKYEKKWGYMLQKTRYPNVYLKEKGGYLVRGRVQTPSGLKDILRSLDVENPLQALNWLEEEKIRLKAEAPVQQVKPVPYLSGYARSHLERKLARKRIKSASGEEKWRVRLKHILGGVEKKAGGQTYVVEGLGIYPLTELRPQVEVFLDQCATMVNAGIYSPVTINGWLTILRTMSRAATLELDIPDFMRGVEDLDTSECATYTDEEPNSLRVEDVPRFLDLMHEHWPQHFAMVLLGTVTGQRPSTLRPLRRTGPESDVVWDASKIWMRRSATRGQIMQTTKTGIRYPIHCPQAVLDTLQWHIDTQLSDIQLRSELLFPAEDGSLRSDTVLRKPFEDVSTRMALGYRITPRAMRRTFQDLSRAAGVEGLVTRSISGHGTQAMADWYSTVNPSEQVSAVSKIYEIATSKVRAA